MFGKLNRLLRKDVLLADPFFQFITLYDAQIYVPYAVSLVSISPDHPRYMQLIVPRFQSGDEQKNYVGAPRSFSAFSLPIEVQSTDRMLTLITCHGNEHSERLVVGLRALRPDESEKV